MEDSIQFGEFVLNILYKTGPIKVDTFIAKHNFFLEEDLGCEKYEELCEEDVISIGKPGKKIDKSDIKDFFKALRTRKNQSIFCNDRTYIFEGIKLDTRYDVKSFWYIMWGS